MFIKRLKSGFTLIELMLIIAVMAALVTVGIAAFSQKMQNAKIDQAALQMQTWLQAGLAFRVNDSLDKWPTMENIVNNGYIKNYSNPWRECNKNTVGNCYEVINDDKVSKNFIVKMKIPQNVPNARGVAELIVKRLPNAESYAKNQDIIVSAEVPLPAQIAAGIDQVIVKNIRYVSNAEGSGDDPNGINPTPKLPKIDSIICPAEMKPFRYSTLNRFSADNDRIYAILNYRGTSILEEPTSDNQVNIVPDNYFTKEFGTNVSTKKGQILVIDACVPDKKSTNVTTTTDNFRF